MTEKKSDRQHMAKNREQLAITIDKDVLLAIDRAANERRLARSHLVERLLVEGLERLRPADEVLRLTE